MPTTPFRLRDALRDAARCLGGARALFVVAVVALALAPLAGYTIRIGHRIAHLHDGRVALHLYERWCAVAIVLAVVLTRAAAALIAPGAARALDGDPPGAGGWLTGALGRGVPALAAAAVAALVSLLGLAGLVVFAVPLAAALLVAAPVAAVDRLGPSAAIRRSAALTRGAIVRLGAWVIALVAVEVAPLIAALRTSLHGHKPPVHAVGRALAIHAAVLAAAALVDVLVQVGAYRRLRDAT